MSSTAEDIASSDIHRLPCRQGEIIPNNATIKHTMDQMGAPQQPDESSETYARRYAATQHVHETPMRGLNPLKGPDNNESERIANERFIENLARPNSDLDVPSSQTGLIVPVEMKPSIMTEQVGPSYPTCPHTSPETNGKDIAHSVAVETHVLCVPGREIPDVQEHMHREDAGEMLQSSMTNTSCERELVHTVEDSQVSSQTPSNTETIAGDETTCSPANKQHVLFEMIRNDTACSITTEPLASVPGHEVPDTEEQACREVEELTQPSTTNTSCKREVICKTEDSQMLLQTQPASKPRIVESEHRDVRTNTQGLVIEQGLDVVDILCKGKRSRPPDVNSSMIIKNNVYRYSELSSSFVRSDAQVTKKLENLIFGRDSVSEDVGDMIHAGKRGRPPDIEQVQLRNDKCRYSGILKGNVRRTEYGTHTILKVENST
jgi:hypothetical protein